MLQSQAVPALVIAQTKTWLAQLPCQGSQWKAVLGGLPRGGSHGSVTMARDVYGKEGELVDHFMSTSPLPRQEAQQHASSPRAQSGLVSSVPHGPHNLTREPKLKLTKTISTHPRSHNPLKRHNPPLQSGSRRLRPAMIPSTATRGTEMRSRSRRPASQTRKVTSSGGLNQRRQGGTMPSAASIEWPAEARRWAKQRAKLNKRRARSLSLSLSLETIGRCPPEGGRPMVMAAVVDLIWWRCRAAEQVYVCGTGEENGCGRSAGDGWWPASRMMQAAPERQPCRRVPGPLLVFRLG